MNIAIISSTKDKASANIKENLINNFNFEKLDEKLDNNNIFQFIISNNVIKLYTINSELIFTDNLDKRINADVFIFISKHRAQEGRANLTCHAIGNFGKAEHGGKEKTLCNSMSFLLKNVFIELNKNIQNTDYEATLEATHHGPFMEKPVLFVELGSNEEYWADKKGGFLVAKSVMGALEKFNGFAAINNDPITEKNNETDSNYKKDINNGIKNYNSSIGKKDPNNNENYESVFVIGGSHYNHVANKVMLQSNLAVGHICAKYNLGNLDESLIKEAMKKIIPKAKLVLLDWKGLGKEKQRILDLLERNDIEYKRNDKFFKNNN